MIPETFARAFVLTGPTGAGKSAVGVQLAEALGAEIISMDSMALYRGMDIGTAKPTAVERRQVPHHLIDVLDPCESATVAWWLERAADCCKDIDSRGRRVLLVGGTPMYLKALLFGLFQGPPANNELRQRLLRQAQLEGNAALHRRLAEVDSASAKRLHPNDVRRVVRALEVWEATGKPISAWQQQWPKSGFGNRTPAAGRPQCWWLDLPRRDLYERIDRRVSEMIEAGLLDEVRRLKRSPRPLSSVARQALGYKELLDHLEGRISLEDAVRQIKTRSRNFAKRQLTWFRHLPGCRPVSKHLTFASWGLTIG
jgi:tRNA dimethylallyltransferase